MRKETGKRTILVRGGVSVVAVALVAAAAAFGYLHFFRSNEIEKELVSAEESGKTPKEESPSYITDTCFDGSAEVDPVLYSIPFQKSDNYVRNKDLMNYLDRESVESMEGQIAAMVKELFGTSGTVLVKQYDEYAEHFQAFFSEDVYIDETDRDIPIEQLLAEYMKDISDAGWEADVTFDTDKSLLFSDLCYYLRGLVTVTVYGYTGETDLSYLLPIKDLERGKTYQFIMDVGFTYSNQGRDSDNLKICSLENIQSLDASDPVSVTKDVQ